MSLWGGNNSVSAVNKPKHGFPKYFGMATVLPGANSANTFGVTANGATDPAGTFGGKTPGHAGWINMSLGKGYVNSILSILAAGNNIPNGSYSIVTGGNGSVGNILTLAVRSQGQNYNSAPNVCFVPSPASAAQNGYISVTMGGRTGRFQQETIVAMGSLTGYDSTANNWYANNS